MNGNALGAAAAVTSSTANAAGNLASSTVVPPKATTATNTTIQAFGGITPIDPDCKTIPADTCPPKPPVKTPTVVTPPKTATIVAPTKTTTVTMPTKTVTVATPPITTTVAAPPKTTTVVAPPKTATVATPPITAVTPLKPAAAVVTKTTTTPVAQKAAVVAPQKTAPPLVKPLTDKQKLIIVTTAAGEATATKVVTDYMAKVQASIDKRTAPSWALVDDTTKANYYVSQKVLADNLGIKAFNDSVASVEKSQKVNLTSSYEKILKSDTAAGSTSLIRQVNNILLGIKYQKKLDSEISDKNDPRIKQTIDAAKQFAAKGTNPIQATFQAVDKIYGHYNTQVQILGNQRLALAIQSDAILTKKNLTYQQKYDQVNSLLEKQMDLSQAMFDIIQGTSNNTSKNCNSGSICTQLTKIAQDVLKGAFKINTTVFSIKPSPQNFGIGHDLLRIAAPIILGARLPDTFIDLSHGTVSIGGTYETAFLKLHPPKPAPAPARNTPIRNNTNTTNFGNSNLTGTNGLNLGNVNLTKPFNYTTDPNLGSFGGLGGSSSLGNLGSLGSLGSYNLAGPGTLTTPSVGFATPRFDWGSAGSDPFNFGNDAEYNWDNDGGGVTITFGAGDPS